MKRRPKTARQLRYRELPGARERFPCFRIDEFRIHEACLLGDNDFFKGATFVCSTESHFPVNFWRCRS